MMTDKTNEVLAFHAIWATAIGVMTMAVRPFISFRTALRNTVITFMVSFLTGLIMEYYDIFVPVKCGISGIAGLFAVSLYNIISKVLTTVEKDPIGTVKDIKEEVQDIIHLKDNHDHH